MDDYDKIKTGIDILQSGGVTEITLIDKQFRVYEDKSIYTVTLFQDNKWTCECNDYIEKNKICGHIWACIMKINLDNHY